ncbi:unnamed protein product [Closterium sp. NIES-64]|nr:unnamed protein product [Closterium sp. NIES-64]
MMTTSQPSMRRLKDQVVRCLLIEPYPESALNEDAGKLLLEDYEAYAKHARLFTSIHAPSSAAAGVSMSRSKSMPQHAASQPGQQSQPGQHPSCPHHTLRQSVSASDHLAPGAASAAAAAAAAAAAVAEMAGSTAAAAAAAAVSVSPSALAAGGAGGGSAPLAPNRSIANADVQREEGVGVAAGGSTGGPRSAGSKGENGARGGHEKKKARWLSPALAAAVVACVLLPLPLPLPPQHTPPAMEQGRAAGSRSLGSAWGRSWGSAWNSAQAMPAPFSGASAPLPSETFDNVPQSLSGGLSGAPVALRWALRCPSRSQVRLRCLSRSQVGSQVAHSLSGTPPGGPVTLRCALWCHSHSQVSSKVPQSLSGVLSGTPVALRCAVRCPSRSQVCCQVPQSLSVSLVSILSVHLHFAPMLSPPSEDDRKPRRIQKPKTPAAEKCLRKCVGTCIRGGAGAPGEGPINVER